MARESGWWDCRHSMFGWRGVNRCGRRAIRGGATLAEISPAVASGSRVGRFMGHFGHLTQF